jgi:hypothetical protein
VRRQKSGACRHKFTRTADWARRVRGPKRALQGSAHACSETFIHVLVSRVKNVTGGGLDLRRLTASSVKVIVCCTTTCCRRVPRTPQHSRAASAALKGKRAAATVWTERRPCPALWSTNRDSTNRSRSRRRQGCSRRSRRSPSSRRRHSCGMGGSLRFSEHNKTSQRSARRGGGRGKSRMLQVGRYQGQSRREERRRARAAQARSRIIAELSQGAHLELLLPPAPKGAPWLREIKDSRSSTKLRMS